MSQYTISEFARLIKNKYPAYESRNDSLLVSRYLEKHPVYKDRVILDNAPSATFGISYSQPPAPQPQLQPAPQQEMSYIPQEQQWAQAHQALQPQAGQAAKETKARLEELQNQGYTDVPVKGGGIRNLKEWLGDINSSLVAPQESSKVPLVDSQQMNKWQEQAEANAVIEEQKQLYNEYSKAYDNYRATAKTSKGFKGKASPEQFATWLAGRTHVLSSATWFPEQKELKSPGVIATAGQVLGPATYGITAPIREAIGLEQPEDQYDRMAQTLQNYGEQDRKEDLKNRVAQGETLNEEDSAWLEEELKKEGITGAGRQFMAGVKSIPEMVENILVDSEFRRKFFNDMAAQMPASIAISGGIGSIASGAKALNTAKNTAMASKRASSAKAFQRWKQTQEGYAFKQAAKEAVIKNPHAFRDFLIKDFTLDQISDAIAEWTIEAGMGGEGDLGSFAQNLGEGFAFDGALQTAGKVGKRALTQDKNAGKLTQREFNKTFGTHGVGFAKGSETSGNTVLDIGTKGEGANRSIKQSLETIMDRPDMAEQVKDLAKRRDNDYTQNQKYRYLDEAPDDIVAEAASKGGGKEDINGYYDKKGVANITPQGHTGTQAHETLHGLENHPELKAELAEWVADTKEWAKENGVSLPEDGELVAETFTHKLGYKEPNWKGVENIPVPDALANRMAEALGLGEAGMRKSPNVSHETMKGEKVYDSEGNYRGFKTEDGEMLPFSLTKNETPEQQAKAEEYKKGISYNEARNKLKDLFMAKQTKLRSADGEEVILSSRSIGKLLSNDSVKKSMDNGFKREQHYAAASDIKSLFENSTKVLTHPDKRGDQNVKAMHRFVSPLFGDNGAFITVKESTEHGKKMYSVELIEMGKLEGKMHKDYPNITASGVASYPATSSPINSKMERKRLDGENDNSSVSLKGDNSHPQRGAANPNVSTPNIQNNSPYSAKKDETPKNILAEKSVEMEMDHQLRLKRLEKSFVNNQTHRSQMQADQATKAARQSAGYKSTPDDGITFVERQLTEQKHLTFMGSKLSGVAKIKSSGDVAFLFRNLESAATENGFVVMIKPDGSYSVLYLGTGGTSSTSMEISHIAAAAREMGAVKVSMVHNHPSGLVEASPEDFKVHSGMVKALQGLGIEVMPSVIINLDSGKYGEFTSDYRFVKEKSTGSQGKTKPVKIMQFDRLKMHVPSSQKQVVSTPKDIAEFLSRQKRGTAAKVHAIILSNDNSISRYALLDGDLPYKGLLSHLTAEIGKHGNHVVLATNGSINAFTLNEMKADLKEMGIALIDVIEVKENEEVIKNYRSLVGSRELNEPKAEYKSDTKQSQPDNLFTVAERANKGKAEGTEKVKFSLSGVIKTDYNHKSVYNALVKEFEKIGIAKSTHNLSKSTSSAYYSIEHNGVTYDFRFANHSKWFDDKSMATPESGVEFEEDNKIHNVYISTDELNPNKSDIIGFMNWVEKWNSETHNDKPDFNYIKYKIPHNPLFAMLVRDDLIEAHRLIRDNKKNQRVAELENYLTKEKDNVDAARKERKELIDRRNKVSFRSEEYENLQKKIAGPLYKTIQTYENIENRIKQLNRGEKSLSDYDVKNYSDYDLFYFQEKDLLLKNEEHELKAAKEDKAEKHKPLSPSTEADKEAARKAIMNSVRFSLASTAGIPEGHEGRKEIVERAKKMWKEKGVESPFFKNWFKGSKVVGEDGKPLVVYHGSTSNEKFSVFQERDGNNDLERVGIWFVKDRDLMRKFTSSSEKTLPKEIENRVYPSYLNLRNPLVIDAKGGSYANIPEQEGIPIKDVKRLIYDNGEPDRSTDDYASYAYNHGYDGVIFENISEGHNVGEYSEFDPTTVYVAFRSNQIKSATDNIGTFDKSNPDIRFSLSSLPKAEQEIAHHAPQWRIYNAVLKFLQKDVGVVSGDIDNLYTKAQAKWFKQRKQGQSGMETKHSPELDKLAERIAQDPELRSLIDYDGDEAGAGEKAVDIASDYARMSDREKVELGRKAESGDFSNSDTIDKYPLEDRINNILWQQEIELDGKAYEGKYELNNVKSIKDFIFDKLRLTKKGKNKVYYNQSTDKEVIISGKSAGEIAGHIKDGEAYQKTIAHIPEIIEKMQFLTEVKTDIKKSYYVTPVKIEGKSYTVLSELRNEGQEIYYTQNVFDGMPKDVLEKAKNETSGKYSKLNEALNSEMKNTDDRRQPEFNPSQTREAPTASTHNIHNFSEKSTETDKKSEKIDKTRQNEGENGQNETKDGDLLNALANYKETKADKAQRNLQDKFNFAKTIGDILGLKGADSFYTMETLRHGKKAWLAEKFQEKFADPINKAITDNNLALDDVNDFLYANHALDKNRQLRETEDVKDGSGMSDEEAKAILKELTEKDGAAYRKIRDLNRALNEWKRDLAVEAGVWSKEEAARWAELYPDYVPLKGLSDEMQEKLFGFSGGAGTGMGTQAAKGVQKAHGRKTKAPNVLEQNLAQAMAMISNAENNKTMKALYTTAKNHKIEGFWDIDPEIEDRGKKLNFGDPFYSKAAADVGKNSMVHVFLNGEKHFIRFKTEAGMSLAKNIKDLDGAQRHWLLQGMMKAGRFVKGMFTSYNPVFVPFNGIKDFQHGMFRAFAVDGAGIAAKTAFYTGQVVPATFGIDIAKGASGKKIDMGEWDKWRDKWKQAGGSVGYIQVNNFRDYSSKMQSQLKDTQRKGYNLKKIGNNFLNAIEATNSDIENGIRLAYFRALVEKGTSVEEAAAKSKDLTANFNRKGEMDFLDAPFLFFNADMQGTASLLSPLVSKDKKVRARAWGAAGGLVLAAYAIGMYNRSIAGDDDSGENAYDKIPEYEKRLNLIIMQKNGEAIKIPIPYGLNVIYNMGRLAEAAASSESDNYKGASLGLHMFDNIESSFNFFGSDLDPNEISMSLATIAQGSFIATPFANIAANKDFAGRPIAPENKPEWKPESQNYREGVNPLFRDLAIWLNEVTGGGDGEEYGAEFEGKIRKGLIDWNPHNMEYIWNFATGGLGRIAQQGIGMARSIEKGEEIQPRQVPFYSRVKYKPSPSQDAGAVWETKNETARIRAQKKSYLDQTKEAAKAGDDTSTQETKLGKFYEAAAMREAFGSQASKGENTLKKMIEHGAKTKDDLNKFRAAVAKNRKLVDNIQEAYNKHKSDPIKKKQLEEKFNQAMSDMMKSLD